ncbi:phospholipase D-like domain-containing protein DpdK [Mesorhizobium sp.]|uniref:phospholipase D-like domain-containing protein DpdK n=1 Tax=Mesorhizobium sp. TaxID=1871066 RepID=UPI000FEA5C0E|nr:phospholipase D-like domain-containing protein DpdK [Mesorhizobium sp.]RWO55368.1 MAG: phosphatidylserine/phosphatidylglycerophosphate/cardiolipin synthase family protein [Mesorhizobium sp.]
MASRDFTGPWQSRAILDAFQTLLLREFLRPSPELWILSAWISDVEVVDNSARAFSAVCPNWSAGPIRLSRVIASLLDQDSRVAVVLRDVQHNVQFVRTLRNLQSRADGRLGIALSPGAHEKSVVGEDYILGGSMNLTYGGLTANDEHVLLRADGRAAAARRLALRERWEASLSWR